MSEVIENPGLEAVNNLHEAIDEASLVTLEIGTGNGKPMLASPYGGDLRPGELYVSWDIDPRSHRDMVEQFAGDQVFVVYTHLEDRDAIHEFVPDGSVNRVVVSNVFGEPDLSDIQQAHKTSDFESKVQTLVHAAKLLDKHGELNIVENITPDYAGDFSSPDEAAELLEGLGFKAIVFLRHGDDGFKEEYIRSGQMDQPHPNSFIISAIKG